jgi:hypothetical protein
MCRSPTSFDQILFFHTEANPAAELPPCPLWIRDEKSAEPAKHQTYLSLPWTG